MHKSKILCVVLAVLLVISMIFAYDQYEERVFLQDNIDLRFQMHFSTLCDEMAKDREDMDTWTANTKLYAHTMGAYFANTTYSERPQLSNVVWALCSRAELNTLYEIADTEMINALSRLAHDIENESLAKAVYEDYIVGKTGT